MSKWFHTHVHSEFSILDAISSVDSLAEKAAKMGQPGLGMMDHGNLSATVQLYKAGQKYGLQVFPGFEGYLTTDPIDDSKESGKLKRYHIGLLSLNRDGYKGLAQLSSRSHTRPRFNRFPRFDLSDLAEFASEDVAVFTGCYFGLVQQTLVEKGERQAQRIVEMYAKWFPNTFVEIQNHDIAHSEQATEVNPWTGLVEHDDDICDQLVAIADRVGLPVIVTQDSHYCDSKDKLAHELMKRMVYGGEDGVNEFPGDSFHLATTEWVKERHSKKNWRKGLEGSKTLLELHDLEFPALDKFKAHVPSQEKNPNRWLRRRGMQGLALLKKRGLLKKSEAAYLKRINHEIDIIEFLGHAGYFTIIMLIIEFCKRNTICVEARGSANGSLVCYLLGITSIDPLEWDLLFERFLSRDRKKPPDIDLDVEDVRRGDVLDFLAQNFEISQIGTFAALGARAEDDKGNILVSYNSYLRRRMGDAFVPKYGSGLESIAEIKNISTADYVGMRQLSKSKVKRSYGVHPAGIVLGAKTQKISEYVPTMLVASSNTTVTQFIDKDVEDLGYVKADLLGQRTLTVLRRVQEMIGRTDPTDFSWIPKDDRETCRYLAKGYTDNGVFQFEGYAMALGARGLKIRSTNDCILAGALFRPACIDSGVTKTYIERRFDQTRKQDIEYPHPAFQEVLKKTNGVVLFQEQVLEIMRRLGLDYEGINTFFSIVKDSGKGATARNLERIKEVEKQWKGICKRNKIKNPDWAWHYIEGYTKYGFNKAHATGYGLRSYRAGYLKVHYPKEFMAALLECWAGKPKEKIYIKEARKLDIRLLQADVNISDASWTLDRKKGAIRRGLSSISGIGRNAAEEIASNRPYESVEDLIDLNSARTVSGAPLYKKEGKWSGNLLKLREVGALNSLGIGRASDD